MARIRVAFDIRSSVENQTYTVFGVQDGNAISFQDPNGETHRLTMTSKDLSYQKQGDATMDFTFDPTTATSGTYKTAGQTFHFTIRTLQYRYEEGRIRLNYQLYQQQDRIGHTILSVDYQPAKEE